MDTRTHGALRSLQLTDLRTNARSRGFFDVHPRARNRARRSSRFFRVEWTNGRMHPPCEGRAILANAPSMDLRSLLTPARDELLPVVWRYCLGVTRSG